MKLSRQPPQQDPEPRRQPLSRLHSNVHQRHTAEAAATTNDHDGAQASRSAPNPDTSASRRGPDSGALAPRGGLDPDEIRGGWTPPVPLPDRLKGPLWTLSPRHVVVLALILLAGLLWAGYALFRTNPEPIPNPPGSFTSGTPVATPSSAHQPSTTPKSPVTVVVDVAGKVRRPGLVHARAGSRVADVLAAAGGALPGVDLTTLNLARQVTDGEQIVVGAPATASTGTPNPTHPAGTPATSTTPVDLNTATLAQLDSLPGVGPVLAQRILDWRTEHGRFTTTDELQEIPGVGPKKFESLKPHVRT
ncbi:ComEA family DNA-binding protein [Kribbella ginsengisoli]|uniref:ComEA family DNA-binding protein n=1 Tax=Kribbella ginsengisoli TaxID=363865 RepID=A0ABP6X423_9ACTN